MQSGASAKWRVCDVRDSSVLRSSLQCGHLTFVGIGLVREDQADRLQPLALEPLDVLAVERVEAIGTGADQTHQLEA